MDTLDQKLIYKALGVQAIAFAIYLVFTGVNTGITSISIVGISYTSSALVKMENVGLILAGLVLAFSGAILFRVKEKRIKVSGSLFIIAGILAAVAAIIVLLNNGSQGVLATFLLGIFIASNTMAMPILGLSIIRTISSEDNVLKYSTALYIITPILTVYGLLGLSLTGLVSTTILYVESQGLPEQAEKLTETMEKVIPEQ
ncbi:MAG: hypothetical protein F7B60_05820 [Desulfurococcales archaeon]|nr:hypothetical protein [Desulfurococcales archaeon]